MTSHQRPSGSGQRATQDDFDRQQQPSSAGRARRTTTARSAARASPYARTPTKQIVKASDIATPPPGTSPSMLSGFISMISPFRSYSRARQSAAFGSADAEEDRDGAHQQIEADSDSDAQHEKAAASIAESARPSTNTLTVPTDAPFAASPSKPRPQKMLDLSASPSLRPRASPRESSPLPRRTAPRSPLAETAPGLPYTPQEPPRKRATRYSSQADFASSTQRNSHPDASPVSRNFDLLARFFAEKGRQDGSSGLTEVEVEGCLKLIEESMAAGRDLAHEFGHVQGNGHNQPASLARASSFGLPKVERPAASSRASSTATAPNGLPAAQTFGGLFHPGSTSAKPTGPYSFLAPRSSSTATIATAAAARRHRPLYLGPGMGSQLTRRRTMAPRSLADSLAQSRRNWLPTSTSDTSLVDAAKERQQQQQQQKDDAAEDLAPREEPKRRRTDAVQRRTGTEAASQQNARFDNLFESQRTQSQDLAKKTTSAAGSTATGGAGAGVKRSAPSGQDEAKGPSADGFVNGLRPAQNSTPARAQTRTATAMLDILKDSPPVRPPVQPELVNPYQTSSTLSKLPKKAKAQTPSQSARASMTTRAKARQTAAATTTSKDKEEPKRESILDVIERTAPKEKPKRGRNAAEPVESSATDAKADDVSDDVESPSVAAGDAAAAEARKAEKTEEARRRLAALSKSRETGKTQTQTQSAAVSAPTPTFSFGASSGGGTTSPSSSSTQQATFGSTGSTGFSFSSPKPATSLAPQLPPQYTASKPKKPSPLSAAFQAPDSPSSASEKSVSDSPAPPSKAALNFSQPKFSFSSPSTGAEAAPAAKPISAPMTFSFGASSAPAATTASTNSSTSAAPAPVVPSPRSSSTTTSFSFSPITPAITTPLASATAPSSQPPTKALPAPAATSTSPAEAKPTAQSAEEEALAAEESSLPTFRFNFSTPAGSDDIEKESAAIKKEVQDLAVASLPKFEFVFGTSAAVAASKKDASEPKAAPSTASSGFSFGKPAAAPPAPAESTSSFSFSEPAASAAAPASNGFSFSPAGGSSGFGTPTSAPAPVDETASTGNGDGGVASGEEAGGSNGLLGEGEGEEDETQTHEVRAKFWRFDAEGKSWKDLGIVIAKLKKHKETSKRRMLVRNEANGKVVVNFNIYATIKVTQDKNVVSFLGFDGSTPTQYRCKIKTEDSARAFKEAIEREAAEL